MIAQISFLLLKNRKVHGWYIYLFILDIKKTTPFSTFGLDFSFQKYPQFSISIKHVTNK